MNRVYKVIWSKAKHCYVVTSEIARSVTKSASSARSAGRKGAAVLAMAALLFTAGGVLGEAAYVTDIEYGKTADVIMVTKDDGTTTPITITDVDRAIKANSDGDGLVIKNTYAKKTDAKDNLKVGDDGVISKVTGNDGTTSSAVKTLVLNKDGDNQITMDEKGIKVGKNSTVIASDGVFAGGDTATAAKAALNADGSIKGADGDFTVDADGNVATKGGSIKTNGGVIQTGGGNINTQGGVLRTNGGNINAGNGLIRTTGTVKAGDVQTGTLTTTGNVTIGGALTVNGKLDMDEIYMTKDVLGGDNDVTAKTKVAAGEITAHKTATITKDGSIKESAIDYDENGTSTWAKATDADGKWNKSILTVEGTGIKSTATDTDGKNKASTNLSNKGFNTFASDGTNKTYTKQTATDIKNTAEKGMISHTAKNLVNRAYENMANTVDNDLTTTVGGEMKTTVTGNVTEDYKANLTTTVKGLATENFNNGLDTNITGNETHDVSGTMTTTVTGDSSLTAENITNEAKNKITNKALDVETDAASSIVSKVSNDYGSNTSTQLSHQTMEEMKAEGKTASYLRGAAEEKSQLTDGAKKTTIDTVAGQTNTNITEGKNVSNSLQKADQIASSVTDGTNTTVVNQNAGNLASSITDGTKANNTSSTVDKSEQLIKVDNTHFYAETKTAGSAVEALKSDGNTIISAKDAVTGTVSSAVTDGTNTTGSTMTAKGITNSAAESIVNEIGDGSKVKSEMTAKGITNTAKDGTITNDAKDLVNTASNSITDKVGENVERTMGTKKIEESVKDGTKSNTFTKTAKKDMNIITDGTNTSTLSQLADKVNTSLKEVDGAGNTTKSLNNVKTVSEDTTKMTDTASGEFSKRSQTVSQIQDKVGKTTVTTIDGKTTLTDEDHNHTTEMDYANVTKDLSVYRNTTLGEEGEDTILTVNSTSTFKDTVKMEKTLEVDGESTFNNKVTITKGGLDVKGGTTTDTLTVTGTSEFRGKADFKDNVSMGKGLAVAGETKTGTLHVEKDGYVGGNLNVAGNIETHDAVLSADSRQVVTGRQLYQTNERVDKLDNRIKKVGANAAALAALRPGDFNPDDKFSIAAGFGSYRNANAAALGLFYRPNENVLLSLGTSFGDGENMVNAGVSVKFGRGKSMAERRKEMADEVSSMRDEMRSQDERIAELEEMLKKQSELIEKLSKES